MSSSTRARTSAIRETFPTDAELLHAAIKGLTRLAVTHGVRLRQSYLRIQAGGDDDDAQRLPVLGGDHGLGEPLAWRLSSTLDAEFCVAALEEVIAQHGRPDVFNIDQGS